MRGGYNGWKNYETWRVHLEIFDGCDPDGQAMTADSAREIVEEYIEMTSQEGIARDYALAFVQGVDWDEIARHVNETWELTGADA
jgi:hypothetical protein